MGWGTAAAYLAAAILCGWCAQKDRPGSRRTFWLSVAVVIALLGVNKQLDLQSWLTQTGRDLALAQGWYVYRHAAQIGFVTALALGGLSLLLWLRRATRNLGSEIRWAMLGLMLVTLFVLVRAASFHHIDRLLQVELGCLRVNWIVELSGIGCIGAAALRRLKRLAAM